MSLLPWGAHAQYYQADLGYNGHLMSPDGLSFVVDRYNETRSFLTSELDAFNYFDGITGSLGMSVEGIYVEAGYNGRAQRRSAQGTISGTVQRRDLHVREGGFFFGVGFSMMGNNAKNGVIVGMRVEAGRLRVRTRTGAAETIGGVEWQEAHSSPNTLISPFMKVVLGGINVEPYYAFDLLGSTTAVTQVNRAINPATYRDDPIAIAWQGGGFGLRTTFNVLTLVER
ncbi:MAG: hypothetical protein AAF970_19825 [Bacteroidota bacterium]